MIRFSLFVLFLLNASLAFGQGAFVSPDSTRLIFSNHVAIDISRSNKKGKALYELTPLAIRTVQVQYNYVHASLLLSQDRVRLLENALLMKDSTLKILNEQVKTTNERLVLYSSGYKELKLISADYDKQNRQLIADLESARRRNRSANRKRFFEGFAAGLVVTAVYVIMKQ